MVEFIIYLLFTGIIIITFCVIKFNCTYMLHIPIVHTGNVNEQMPQDNVLNYHVENVIKQLVHTSALRSLRYEKPGKFGEHSRS